MYKKSILICLFIFISSQLSAQLGFGKVEDIKALKDRTLLVELKVPNEKTQKN
jgi:hypothetical protein